MSDVAELATRLRLSDPKPARCAACFTSADANMQFVDFDCLIDRGTFTDPGGAGAVLDSIDELHLCESCVRQAAEVLDFKPELYQQLLRRVRLEMEEKDRLKATVRRLSEELNLQIASGLGAPPIKGA